MAIEIVKDVELVQQGKRAAARAEITTALTEMEAGESFAVGELKAGTIKAVAKGLKIKIRIGPDAEGKIYCKKL